MGGILGATEKQALESDGPEILHDAQQKRFSYPATFVRRKQR
jgi:hypothetical protein